MRPDELVGRREQVELLRDAARLAGSGSPQFVVLSGEAGVGKTFLMDRFATELGASGALVLRGGCRGFGEDGFPLVLVTTVLRQLIASQGTECVTAGAPGAEALLGLLPELGKPRTGPESQARLFDLFCDLLRRLSATQAVLLLVEDLQHAGASIRELLGYLARTLHTARVLVLTAYRTGEVDRRHPLRPFLAEFGRLPGARRVDISPFSRAELAEFVSVVRHGPVPASSTESTGDPAATPFSPRSSSRPATTRRFRIRCAICSCTGSTSCPRRPYASCTWPRSEANTSRTGCSPPVRT